MDLEDREGSCGTESPEETQKRADELQAQLAEARKELDAVQKWPGPRKEALVLEATQRVAESSLASTRPGRLPLS